MFISMLILFRNRSSFRLFRHLILILALCLPGRNLLADTDVLRVGLEPFPPLINEDKTGYSVDWLKALARKADMQLQIDIMPYSRAKIALMTQQVDLIGHTPYGLETNHFYSFATELDHRFPTKLDVFSLDPDDLDLQHAPGVLIGTPFGNSGFIADVTGIKRERFVEGSLQRVVAMMLAGRIDTVIFERMSVVNQIRERAQDNVHYRLVRQVDAGFAVNSNNTDLLRRLNTASEKVDAAAIYAPYTKLLNWPDSGIVPPHATQ